MVRDYSFDNIIGRSVPIVQIFESIKKIADSNINVLITGASGTGTELIARSIHTNSFRHGKPFVPINCGALPHALQVKFLRALEDGNFRRLGSNQESESDFRLICATNQNLDRAVEEGGYSRGSILPDQHIPHSPAAVEAASG